MFSGEKVVELLRKLGVTHVVWVPDSELGQWESALAGSSQPELIRVCREGEAYAVAAGLMLGGKRPVVMLQCTGFFESGDAFRNAVHDLGLPIFVIVGYRGYYGKDVGGRDTAAQFIEPVLRAWGLPYRVLTRESSLDELGRLFRACQATGQAAAALVAEGRL